MNSKFFTTSPLYEEMHSWFQNQLSHHIGNEKWECKFCERIIATQNLNYHFSGSVCSKIRTEIDPDDRPLIKLIFQDLKKIYSSSKKDYWMSQQEQSWLTFRYVIGYCCEGRNKYWLFKKMDNGYEWVSNSTLYISKLGQTLI
jgi:hypothetical protein